MFLLNYAQSPFRDFESCLRIVIGLDEDDIHLNLKQYRSKIFTFEIPPSIYSIKDISAVVCTMRYREGTLRIENDDNSLNTKLILRRFGGVFGKLRIDDEWFFNTILGFTPY